MVKIKPDRTDKDKLAITMHALAQICEVASDQEKEYPERIGAIKTLASRSLHQCGASDWFKEFNKQLELRLQGGP
jgi:hypothetical protein